MDTLKNFNIQKLQGYLVDDIHTDIIINLKHQDEVETLKMHKIILWCSSNYFAICECFKKVSSLDINLETFGIQVAKDLLMSFYGHEIKSNDFLYWMEMVRCQDFFGTKIDTSKLVSLEIPINELELLFETFAEINIPMDNNSIELLERCIPADYDIKKIPVQLMKKMIDARYVIISQCDYKLITWGLIYSHKYTIETKNRIIKSRGVKNCEIDKYIFFTHNKEDKVVDLLKLNDHNLYDYKNFKNMDIDNKFKITFLPESDLVAFVHDKKAIIKGRYPSQMSIPDIGCDILDLSEKFLLIVDSNGIYSVCYDSSPTIMAISVHEIKSISVSNERIVITDGRDIHLGKSRGYIILKSSEDKFNKATFSSDGKKIVASSDNKIILFDVKSAMETMKINTESKILDVMFFDSHYIISRDIYNKILIHNLDNGKCVKIIEAKESIDNITITSSKNPLYSKLIDHIFSIDQ